MDCRSQNVLNDEGISKTMPFIEILYFMNPLIRTSLIISIDHS